MVKGLFFFFTGDFGNFIPFSEGFLNFKLFSFPKIFETLLAGFSSVVFSIFVSSWLLIVTLSLTIFSSFGTIVSGVSVFAVGVSLVIIFSSTFKLGSGTSCEVVGVCSPDSAIFFNLSLSN